MSDDQENIGWEEKFKDEYVLILLRTGEAPVTVFNFCENLNIGEAVFYQYFNSFRSLEKAVWKSFYNNVRVALEQDDEYPSYSAHEKYLSFLYTIVEVFKQNRSYVALRFSKVDRKAFRPWFLETFKEEFSEWTKEVLGGGFETEEIVSRPVVSSKYHEVLWGQLLYITRVWVNDESEDFQITDAAIEKSTALLFELMKKGPVDLMIDFLKFAYQNKAY